MAMESARAVVERGVRDDLRADRRCSAVATSSSPAGSPRNPASRSCPCTGIYTYDYLPMFFVARDADVMADLFVHDIEQGIQGTGIKAAFLKCAADEPGVTENIEKVHRAVARASVRTGAPIMAHSRPASQTAPPADRDLRRGGRRPVAGSRSRTPATPTTSTTSSGCSTRASTSAWTDTGSRSSCRSRSETRP